MANRRVRSFISLMAVFFIVQANTASSSENKVRLINVQHDGYCFYHAIAALKSSEESGHSLYKRLKTFIDTCNIQQSQQLTSLLSSSPVESNLTELTEHLSNPPLLSDANTWAGAPEAVALSVMIDQPILVLFTGADLAILPESFLVNSNGVHPLYSPSTDNLPIPELQVILSGHSWFALQTISSNHAALSQSNNNLRRYIQQLQRVLTQSNRFLRAFVVKICQMQLTLDSRSWPSLCTITAGEDFTRSEENLIKIKALTNQIKTEQAHQLIESTRLDNSQFTEFKTLFREQSQVLFQPTARNIFSTLLSDYFSLTGFTIEAFNSQVASDIEYFWSVIDALIRVAEGLPQEYCAENVLAGIIQNYQAQDVSAYRIESSAIHYPETLSTGFPSTIEFQPDVEAIEFDPNNPLHHLFFSLYISSMTFELSNQLLTGHLATNSALTSNELNYLARRNQRVDQNQDDSAAASATPTQSTATTVQNNLTAALRRITVMIHALGRHYFSEQWQPDSYQCITIRLRLSQGSSEIYFIVFHSDSFVPRGGWRDRQLPE